MGFLPLRRPQPLSTLHGHLGHHGPPLLRLDRHRRLPCLLGPQRTIFGFRPTSFTTFRFLRRWVVYGLPISFLSLGALTVIANYPARPNEKPQLWNWLVGPTEDDEPCVIHRGKEFNWKDATLARSAFNSTIDNRGPIIPGNDSSAIMAESSGNAGESLTEKVTSLIIPDWARLIPSYITKLQNELSAAPGSLAEEMWQDAHDPQVHPEIIMDASVRISEGLCPEELEFLKKRKLHTRKALASYLGLQERDIHPDDVPVIAMCGSGGGLRALVAGSASYLSACEDGLFDCLTYTAGVSGSCWLQTLYYSTLACQSHQKLLEHLKSRLSVHIADPSAAMPLLTSAPTNKYLLSGVFEKARGGYSEFGIVDLYGLLLGARLMVPKHALSVNDQDLKISSQQKYIDRGQQPLPIYTAVRHQIPLGTEAESDDGGGPADEQANKSTQLDRRPNSPWFQWFEFTPYEFWCEEWTAGIPIWALGRHFQAGESVPRENGLYLPEQRIPFLMGIWGSAFCATLSHYYAEIRPILKGLTGFSNLDSLIQDRDEDLSKIHPIQPAAFPNFARGLKSALSHAISDEVDGADDVQLMDAGMSNNLPIYPLLRPGRNVDIIVAFDTSADVKTDNWLSVVDGYARQRGIKGWPIGAGWPKDTTSPGEAASQLEQADAETIFEASDNLNEAKKMDQSKGSQLDGQGLNDQAALTNEHNTDLLPSSSTILPSAESRDLSYCNIWIGSVQERRLDQVQSGETKPSGRDPSKLVQEDWELMSPDAGICVIYFPFLANKKAKTEAAAAVDPRLTDYMSTWNFTYTPEQIDIVTDLARANYDQGRERMRRAVRAVYERKKKSRLDREAASRQMVMRNILAQTGTHIPVI